MRRRGTLIACATLAALVVVAAGVEGSAHFSGLRWIPNFALPTQKPRPRASTATAGHPALPRVHSTGQLGATILQIVFWVVVVAAVVGAVLLLIRWLRRRPSRLAPPLAAAEQVTSLPDSEPENPDAEADAPAVRRGVALAISLLDAEREPNDAIVKAWLGLQETAEDAGIQRRAAETPTEFTTRILQRVTTDDRAVKTLLNLYLRVRFGDHPTTAADVARARDALEHLAASWDARDARNARVAR